MELLRYRVKSTHRNFSLRPFGDLQMGEAGFRKDLWERWKRDAAADKNALFIGMGDYSDRFRGTVAKKLRGALVDDYSAWGEMDEWAMKEMQSLADELKPIKERIIGLHCGHHHWQMKHGGCTCQYLCQLLRVKHLGFVAMIQLVHDRIGDVNTINIYSTHGCGGAASVSADLANLERKIMPNWEADLYLRAHSTRAYFIESQPLSYLAYRRGKNEEIPVLKKKKRLLVNTGGFMEGYVEGEQGYVEKSNMPQINLGWCVVNFNARPDGEESLHISVQVETE